MLDVNLLTDLQFCVELDKAIDRQLVAKNKYEREDAVNEVLSLISLRANGNGKTYQKWILHYDGRIFQAYG